VFQRQSVPSTFEFIARPTWDEFKSNTMDPISITAGVISGVSGLISIYAAGRKQYEKWRTKRKEKKAAEEELQTSLEKAPNELDQRCQGLSKVHGREFDKGDGTYLVESK